MIFKVLRLTDLIEASVFCSAIGMSENPWGHKLVEAAGQDGHDQGFSDLDSGLLNSI